MDSKLKCVFEMSPNSALVCVHTHAHTHTCTSQSTLSTCLTVSLCACNFTLSSSVLWWTCLCVCLSVCPWACLRNHMSKLHQLFCAWYVWLWLGSALAAFWCVVLQFLWMSSCLLVLITARSHWRRQLWEFTRSRQGPENVCHVLGTKVKFEN